MRTLYRTENHRYLAELIVLSLERQLVGREPLENDLEGFVIDLAGLGEIEAVSLGLERRDAAAHAELKASVAHVIEHADFLDQAQRMVERQEVDQRAEAQSPGALRHRG